MSVALVLLSRAWPYLLAATLGAAGAYKWQGLRIASLETESAKYHAQVAEASSAAAKAYAKALQDELDRRLKSENRNHAIESQMDQIQKDAVAARRDADFSQRLLAAASKARPTSTTVPTASNQPAAPDPAASPGDRPVTGLAGLIADAAAECRTAFEYAYGIHAELVPQL